MNKGLTAIVGLMMVAGAAAFGCGDNGKSGNDAGGGSGGASGAGGRGGGGSGGGTGGGGSGGSAGMGGSAGGGSGGAAGAGGRGGTGGGGAGGGGTGGGGAGGSATDGGAGRDGGGGTGGGGGAGGSGGGGGAGGSAACNYPACIANLARDCQGTGACTSQVAGFAVNICYANGVKFLTTVDVMRMVAVIRVTKTDGTSTCFSVESPFSMTGASGMLTYKDAAGATVATGVQAMNGDTTITCTGQAPVTVPASCGMMGGMGGMGGMGNQCMMGTCM